jgi:hypothetical protein
MATKTAFETFQFVTYDVWGNSTDGFEVNAAYTTSERIQVPVGASDKKFLSVAGIDGRTYEVDPVSDETTVYIRRKRDGRPEGEYRLVG